jgi:hypothetical protein
MVALMVFLAPLATIEWETLLQFSGSEWLDHRETLIDMLYALILLAAFFAVLLQVFAA